jgi:hypothetical protein
LLPESSPEEMRSTTTLLPESSLEESSLTSMRADHFFPRVEEKTLPLHGGRRWSPLTWPLRACTTSSPGLTKNRPLPWSTEEDARGRWAGMTPLRHLGTSLSWRGRLTAPWKMDGDMAMGPPPCRTSPRVTGHTCDRDEAVTETRKAEAREGDRRRKAGQSVY